MKDVRAEMLEKMRQANEAWVAQQAAIEAEYADVLAGENADPLLTVSEAASYRGVASQTILNAIKRGTLAALHLHTADTAPRRREYRIRKSELDRYERSLPFPILKGEMGENARQTIHEEGYVTMGEAAKMIGVSRSRVEQLSLRRRDGSARLYREMIAGRWAIRRSEVQSFVDDRALKSLRSLSPEFLDSDR